MNIEKFIKDLREALEFEEELNLQTNLKELEDWDSMAAMILVAFVSDNFDKNLTTEEVKNVTTVDSLIDQIGRENFS